MNTDSPRRLARLAATQMLTGVVALSQPVHADTFGGQVHAVRSKTALEDASIKSSQSADSALPSALELDGSADLVGADFRFDGMLSNLRFGGALMLFGVRNLRLAPSQHHRVLDGSIDDGFGTSLEAFLGYEPIQGPVYLYVDVRMMVQGFGTTVRVRDAITGSTASVDYARASVGAGPRLGALVPVGHSLMIDLAIYQRAWGGLEGTTAFVGLGYWENDRGDAFTDEIKGSYGGEF